MKDFLLKYSVLKVLSLVLAIFLWLYVIIIVDPPITLTLDEIPIIQVGKCKEDVAIVSESEKFLEIEITGSRKEIAEIKKENITATVDLSKVVGVGKTTVSVDVSVPYPYDEITTNPKTLSFVAEKVEKKIIDVEVETIGEIAEGFHLSDSFPHNKTIEVLGAASSINRIKKAVVMLDVKEADKDVEDTEIIFFVDNNGERIDRSDLIYKNVKVKVKDETTLADEVTITAECNIMKEKENVKIDVDLGELASLYKVVDVTEGTTSVKMVDVRFDHEEVDDVSSIMTEKIDAALIDSELEHQEIKDVKLVIPEDVELARDIKTVTVIIEKIN